MSAKRSIFLAAYDVRERKRLRNALKVARAYASGGQKSAHECWLTESEIDNLLSSMSDTLDTACDSFMLIPLSVAKPVRTFGVAAQPANPDYFYMG